MSKFKFFKSAINFVSSHLFLILSLVAMVFEQGGSAVFFLVMAFYFKLDDIANSLNFTESVDLVSEKTCGGSCGCASSNLKNAEEHF